MNAGLCPSCLDVWAGAPLHESATRGVWGHHLPTTSLEPSLEYLKAQNQACRSALLNAEGEGCSRFRDVGIVWTGAVPGSRFLQIF